MKGSKRRNRLIKDLPIVIIFVICGTGLMVYLDAYEWFYRRSPQYETYDYEEIVAFLFLFLVIGMLWLMFRLYREATRELESHRTVEEAQIQPRLELEDIPLRDAQLGLFEALHRWGGPLSDSYKFPLRLLISLVLVIAVVEAITMILMQFLPPLSVFALALIDSAFLSLVIFPALYFIFFRPLLQQIIIRQRTEKALNQLNLELENRIKQRTAQLQTELDERKRIEKRLVENQTLLRSLSSELSLVEELEKRRLANNLHDNIGHTLAIANNQLGLLEASMSVDQNKDLLNEVKKLVKESIRYTRVLTSELSSPLFSNLSLVSALEWLAEDILEKNGITSHLKVNDPHPSLAVDSQILFLKAIREIMINIVKHAEANNVEIDLLTEDSDIIVVIKDDGVGFDMSAESHISPAGHQGLGIFNVRERLAHLNGCFLINSKPGQGTSVTLTVPKQNAEVEKEL